MMSPRRGAWWLSSVVAVEMALTLSAQPPRASFDVASVKRTTDREVFPPQVGLPGGRFHRANATVADLVQYAYNVMSFQVVGGPEWIRRDRFEIDARAGGDATAEEVRLMVRSLLADRFGFMARWEQRDMEHSVLVVARRGRHEKARLWGGWRPGRKAVTRGRRVITGVPGHGGILTGRPTSVRRPPQ